MRMSTIAEWLINYEEYWEILTEVFSCLCKTHCNYYFGVLFSRSSPVTSPAVSVSSPPVSYSPVTTPPESATSPLVS